MSGGEHPGPELSRGGRMFHALRLWLSRALS